MTGGRSRRPDVPDRSLTSRRDERPSSTWAPILADDQGVPISSADAWWEERDRLLARFDALLYGPPIRVDPDAIRAATRFTAAGRSSGSAPCVILLAPTRADGRFTEPDGQWGTTLLGEHGWAQAVMLPAEIIADGPSAALESVPGDAPGRAPTTGVLSAWASAVSGLIDRLVTDPAIDPNCIAVVGQSRLGKVALLAAARDPRISAVIASQSGLGGAAPLRDVVPDRAGPRETAEAAANRFPYWFVPGFADLARRPDDIPLDSHQLIACCAPRGVLLPNADGDDWADPIGQRVSAEAAAPAWSLFPEAPEPPLWTTRNGVHGIDASEWDGWIDYLEAHWTS